MGADSGDRTARTGNPRGDPDEKADENDIRLPGEVAFFIAKRLRSNVRELEGALNRVIANANFTGRAITIDFVREALRDLLALQEKLVTIDNIQKTVAEYYKIKIADLLSKRRSRSVARPRQMAMALAKSSPTTVCRKSAMRLAGATTLPYFMPVVKLSNCVKKATISKKIFLI